MYGANGKTAFESLVETEIAKRTSAIYDRGWMDGYRSVSWMTFVLGMLAGAAIAYAVIVAIGS